MGTLSTELSFADFAALNLKLKFKKYIQLIKAIIHDKVKDIYKFSWLFQYLRNSSQENFLKY